MKKIQAVCLAIILLFSLTTITFAQFDQDIIAKLNELSGIKLK